MNVIAFSDIIAPRKDGDYMSVDDLVNFHYNKLNESDLHIWKYIHANPAECCNITIEEFAKKCNVSRTTVLRFAKKIGLEGFSELKYALRRQLQTTHLSIQNSVDIDILFDNHFKMINELKRKDFTNCCKLIENSKRIFVVSSGNFQHLLAQELKRVFLKQKIIMHDINGASEMLYLSKCIDENDLFILISFSGESSTIIELARKLKTIDAKMISLTRLSSNSLANLATESIYVSSSVTPTDLPKLGISKLTFETLRQEDYVSDTMFFATIEILYISYVNYILNKNDLL